MISDKLLVNLKILSKIQKNGRISRSCDGIISLENDTVYQPLKRFFTNDSRKQAIFEINSIINECIETISTIFNSKQSSISFYASDQYMKNCENAGLLVNELYDAKNGIQNLKFTYQVDLNTTSQLDIILLKINTCIKDATQKLMYLESYIENPNYIKFVPKNKKDNANSEQFKQYELKNIQIDTTTHSPNNSISNQPPPLNNNYDLNMTDINSIV